VAPDGLSVPAALALPAVSEIANMNAPSADFIGLCSPIQEHAFYSLPLR
jgi:hypothetical protein